MQNSNCKNCGGCPLRHLEKETYRQHKIDDIKKTLSHINIDKFVFDEPIFIDDGVRRRADLKFAYSSQKFKLGFNKHESHELVDIDSCPMLCQKINLNLPQLRHFLQNLCTITVYSKNKKKIQKNNISQGKIYILLADNGLDILIKVDEEPNLEHRLLIAEYANNTPDICRISWQAGSNNPETIVQKVSPELYIAGCTIPVPAGVFLQASKLAENAMIKQVLNYLGDTRSKLVDLFCGLGTFTYPLAKLDNTEILSIDSSLPSLEGLQKAINYNQLSNIKILNRNLFKNPLTDIELKNINAMVIDPPRAGAHSQCQAIAAAVANYPVEKIIFISCNPKTFVYDANILISHGYRLDRLTFVDQFVYSNHQELISLFTYNSK